MNARIAEIARNLRRSPPISDAEISAAHVGDQPSGSSERQTLALVEPSRLRPVAPMVQAAKSRSLVLLVNRANQRNSNGRDATEEEENTKHLKDLVAWWKQAREDLKTPSSKVAEMEGEKLNPDRAISARSSVLRTHVGQNSFELYKACCLECDQVLLAQTAHTRVEEHLAHGLDLAQAKEKEALEATATTDARIIALEAQLAAMVEESKKKTEGITEGRDAFLQSDEYRKSLSDARLQGARDFLKAPAFKIAVDLQSARFLNNGFDKCISQVRHLQGFVKGFDQGRLDSSLDATLQPYPDEPILEVAGDDEFASLIADIGAFP
ncbi:hypothetical protein Salat_1090900 [Sesamum alatum]|uniref:Uncharacterized protein n=1 Tax=Sesamum alatum TaxID=300844 RepID=A0AAE1YN46_9LAMI|nr:hypothetical protein Salat_1090900 [Sesamum alatum]